MEPPNSTRKSADGYRFGEYEARVRARVLLRRGHRVRIQELPFRMLIALLEQPGTVLSRDELKNRLWGNETYVDFDGGLRVAAGKLREALGDSALEPRFVKTVFGQGYEFVGEVSVIPEAQSQSEEIGPLTEPASSEAIGGATSAPKEPENEINQLRRRMYFATLGGLLLLFLTLLGFWAWHRNRLLRGNSHLAIAGGIVNHTGNSAFDGTLSRALRVKLEESPYLHLVEDHGLIQKVSHPDSASLEQELAACRALHAEVLLRGEITVQSIGYETSLTAWKCSTSSSLSTQRTHADSDSAVLSALNDVTLQMRRRLGESPESLKSFNVPIAQATTDSMSALRSFARGEEKHLQGRDNDSIPDYKLAVDLDPSFALAYARLGAIYSNVGELGTSSLYLKKAFDLRNRTTDRERLYITTHYYQSVTGEIDKLTDAYELWRSVYPRDPSPLNNLAVTHLTLGDAVGAVNLAKQAVQLDPSSNLFDATLAMSYFRAGNYDTVQKLCNDPTHMSSATFVFHEACYVAAVERNDLAIQHRELAWVAGRPEENGLLNDRAWNAMYSGKLHTAKQLFQVAADSALHNGLADVAAQSELDYAILLADSGLPSVARAQAAQSLRTSPESPMVMAFAALAMARSGDVSTAEVLIEKAAKSSPLDTLLNAAILPTVRAVTLLQRHDPESAITQLQQVRRFDFCTAMQLEPIYYRGLAEEAAGHSPEAEAEFQRLIDHRAIAPRSLYIALSMLELARLLRIKGDMQRSKLLLNQVEQIWTAADRNFPPLARLRVTR